MTLRISDDDGRMTSDQTEHRAVRNVDGSWTATWLPGRELDRDRAITSMTIAETVATERIRGGRLWPYLHAWAAELGIGVDEAIRLARPDGQL